MRITRLSSYGTQLISGSFLLDMVELCALLRALPRFVDLTTHFCKTIVRFCTFYTDSTSQERYQYPCAYFSPRLADDRSIFHLYMK